RTVPRDSVIARRLSEDEIQSGLVGRQCFVPFEKTEDATEGGGTMWRRENPLVIDWSREAVELLRRRARQRERHRKPRLQNEKLWCQGGVTWNSVARYLRARIVPDGAIFGHMTPMVRPIVDWLTPNSLLALLNSSPVDFTVRVFLGSLM